MIGICQVSKLGVSCKCRLTFRFVAWAEATGVVVVFLGSKIQIKST